MAKKTKDAALLVPVKLYSLTDIARYAYRFNFTFDNLFRGANGKGRALFAFGETLNGKCLLYTFELNKAARFLNYKPPDNGEEEQAVLSDEYNEGWQATGILSMDTEGFGVFKNAGKFKLKHVKLGGFEDIVMLAVKNTGEDDGLRCLYCFEDKNNKNKLVFYGINLINSIHDDESVIYYATTELKDRFGFAMYDYKSGKVAPTSRVGEHSYMYLKIINLAERPAFLNIKK